MPRSTLLWRRGWCVGATLLYYQGIHAFPGRAGEKGVRGQNLFRVPRIRRAWRRYIAMQMGGWDRVNYMKEITHFATAPGLTDQKARGCGRVPQHSFRRRGGPAEVPGGLAGISSVTVRQVGDEAMKKIVYVEYDMPGPSRMPVGRQSRSRAARFGSPRFSPFNGIAVRSIHEYRQDGRIQRTGDTL